VEHLFLGVIDFDAPSGRKQTMRWKISHHGHDPRLNDLLAILALVVLIVAAWQYFDSGTHSEPPSKATFIVPSQSVRW
jgi:hypothetical protein